jgi:cysteinyl-tRNA synthetase
LDFNYSHTTNPLDNEVFLDLARHYESEFHADMARLNILPAHVLTRVSEYVPEIIKFIEKIIENGYGYESNSSVYFDTIKFHKQHSYAKLEPDRMGDIAALSEGEGALTTATNNSKEKKNECDFVLWKKSKAGEPVWQSPWGLGRPGWHIECSVMASTVLGTNYYFNRRSSRFNKNLFFILQVLNSTSILAALILNSLITITKSLNQKLIMIVIHGSIISFIVVISP